MRRLIFAAVLVLIFSFAPSASAHQSLDLTLHPETASTMDAGAQADVDQLFRYRTVKHVGIALVTTGGLLLAGGLPATFVMSLAQIGHADSTLATAGNHAFYATLGIGGASLLSGIALAIAGGVLESQQKDLALFDAPTGSAAWHERNFGIALTGIGLAPLLGGAIVGISLLATPNLNPFESASARDGAIISTAIGAALTAVGIPLWVHGQHRLRSNLVRVAVGPGGLSGTF